MSLRRISSRRVVVTASFLALAAGGLAACDNPETETEWDPPVSSGSDITYVQDEPAQDEPARDVPAPEEPSDDEVFYCADEEGDVVDEEFCADDDSAGGLYFLWHSAAYSRNLTPGDRLGGGDYFAPGDRAERQAFGLRNNGLVTNGTVKTNVVGRGSSGSSAVSGTSVSSGG